MDITKLTSKEFSEIMRLLKEKEALQAKLAAIEKRLASLQHGGKILEKPKASQTMGSSGSGKAKAGVPKKSKASTASVSKKKSGRSKPVPLKKLIVEILQNAGSEGLHVKDIAQKLNLSTNNIFSWFYTTGRKFKNIIKVAEGRFAWVDDVSTPALPQQNIESSGNHVGEVSGDGGGGGASGSSDSEANPQI